MKDFSPFISDGFDIGFPAADSSESKTAQSTQKAESHCLHVVYDEGRPVMMSVDEMVVKARQMCAQRGH